ncbi:probable methyltransferase TCM_000336 [Humulus lupulus]|uniref:probable methyltransferase TCM_000336 n=1 Tax=Humulus lupulus TaxID=3486 RepID=UPI002B4035C4|nr:probable methyltransferase TCM_000336 [Humulus lupulus]
MDVDNVFHMTGGNGHTSYTNNSSLQKKASDMVKHITLETVQELYLTTTPKVLGIADLGCSSGPNTLSIIKDIVGAVQTASSKIMVPPPEFQVFLNDLPTNDFNSIFKSLPDFSKKLLNKERQDTTTTTTTPSIFIGGYPGSFYGRLLPNNCLNFVYSSYSLHWLSKVPPGLYDEKGMSINKGSIYISERSPKEVTQAYLKQFQKDFSLFLRARSKEVIQGGRMVLILLGREGPDHHVDRGNSFFWQLLSRSFSILVSKGVIEEEKVDSYDVHFYAPSKDEIEEQVRREGSFELTLFDMFEIERNNNDINESHGMTIAMTVRAIQESMISQHFGEGILDSFFEIYARLIDEEIAKEDIRPITFVVVLKKL